MPSQLGADEWVLSNFKNKVNGFFVDAGCGDGERISNTFLLEQNGWSGIAIDAFPINFINRPNTQIVSAILYSEKDIEKTFLECFDPTLSGIQEHLGYWKNHVENNPHRKRVFKTELLGDILDKYNAPQFIEYLTLDIEESEWEVIKTFPFNKYTFGCITVEHNGEEIKRADIRRKLEENGYKFVKEVSCDDWYIHASNEE